MNRDPNQTAREAASHFNTYHAELDDGKTASVRAESAGHAIARFLYGFRGRRVVRLWSMGREDGRSEAPAFNENMGGRISYDVPPHKPISEEARAPEDL